MKEWSEDETEEATKESDEATKTEAEKCTKQEEEVKDGQVLEKIEEEDNLNEDFFDMNLNKNFRPYRDEKKAEEKNSDAEDGGDDDNSTVGSCTSTVMSVNEVRARVRKSIYSRLKKERRRIKNKGENGVITARNRDINETIYLSLE